MAHIEKLQAIREEICKVVPEIKELKEGCIILAGRKELLHTVYSFENGVYSAYLNKPFPPNLIDIEFYDCEFEEGASDVEIIGRPITLADVIFSLKEFAKKYKLMTGRLFGLEPILLKTLELWSFAKTLDEQDEAVVSFLYQILK